MKKLTDEQIDAKTQSWAGISEVPKARLVLCREYARAIEAEVLRSNGGGGGDAPKQQAKFCFYCGKNTHNDSECWSTRPADWRPRTNVNIGTIGHMGHGATTLTAAISQLLASVASSPRATGCPDTMDDTGHFAEVDMPAFLKRQAPG